MSVTCLWPARNINGPRLQWQHMCSLLQCGWHAVQHASLRSRI